MQRIEDRNWNFVNLSSLPTQGIKIKGKLLNSVQINKAENFSDGITNIVLLTTELGKEINIEIAYNNFIEYIINFLDNKTLTSSKENIIQMFIWLILAGQADLMELVKDLKLNIQEK